MQEVGEFRKPIGCTRAASSRGRASFFDTIVDSRLREGQQVRKVGVPVREWLGVAQVVSSTAAACGLILTAWQMLRTRRVADLQALQKFFESANEHEAALGHSGDDAQTQTHAFNEFLNFLEVYASAHNNKLFGKGSEAMVRHKLEDCYIELDAAPAWHPLIAAALDRSTTFGELGTFIGRHRKEIEARKLERSALAKNRAAGTGPPYGPADLDTRPK